MSNPNLFVSELMQSCLVEGFVLHSNVDTFLTGLIAQSNCVYQVLVTNDFSSDCYPHNYPLKHNLFKYVVVSSSYENKENTSCCLQHQLSFSVVSEVSEEDISGGSEGFSGENNQRSMCYERLGAYQLISSVRPLACVLISSANIQSNVCNQGIEGSDSSKNGQVLSFCGQILESELLCWNCGNSYRSNDSEVYSRTGNEVKVLIHHHNKIAVSPQHTNYGRRNKN
jgi:hypothetical protein